MFERNGLAPCFWLLLAAVFLIGLAAIQHWAETGASTAGSVSAPGPAHLAAREHARIQDTFGKLPLSFIENQGQADARIAYYIQSPGHSLYFTRDGHALRLTQRKSRDAKAHTIKVELLDAAPERIESLERSPGIVSYFKGRRKNWNAAIPTHSKIGYVQPWPGIDLSYGGANGKLESIYTVAPHADPGRIKLRYSGQDALRLDDEGNLIYATSLGEIKETAPIAWQDINGQRLPIETRFTLIDDSTVAFQVAEYNPGHALIIDPTLVYAGYVGGSGDDGGQAIAVDSAGNAYLTGFASSSEASFPVRGGPDLSYNGGYDAFVAKVNPAGTALLYAGYLGGSGFEEGLGIAVDSTGSAYVTGRTESTDFPTLGGPDLTYNGGTEAFVAKVSPAGTALLYAGYIGARGDDYGQGIAVDSAGNAYVTGYTTSFDFPVVVGPDLTYNGFGDAFVAKVNPAGSALVYAGYIGGSVDDRGFAIAVDSAGHAYVTGRTSSSEATFPVLVGPDLSFNGGFVGDAFVAKVNPAGSALLYAGYIGGRGDDYGQGIAVDSAGSAYVTGRTDSTEATFPIVGGPDLTYNGATDAFVVKVNPTGSALVYAGYVGGGADDYGQGIAVDSAGNAYVTGYTRSDETSFPVLGGPELAFNGFFDAFVAKVNPTGSALLYAGYIGGFQGDEGRGIAVDSAGNAYVTGLTGSPGDSFLQGRPFPVVGGPDLTFNGATDAFVAKIAASFAFSGTPSGSNSSLSLVATFTIAPADVGRTGSFYIAAQLPTGQLFFLTPGGFTPYTGGTLPTFSTGTLSNRSITVLSGVDVTPYIGTTLFAGYGLNEADLIDNSKYSVIYTVQ